MENKAPTAKQIAVVIPMPKQINKNNMNTKIINILYSAFKKALAPSRMARAISCIRSVPSCSLLIFDASKKAKTNAAIPNTGAEKMMFPESSI